MIKDETGGRYGRLSVIEFSHSKKHKSGSVSAYWLCMCDCGETTKVRGGTLRSGKTTSCGCYQKELIGNARRTHGAYLTAEYKTHTAMKMRCYNPNNQRYPDYGGRGIKVCDRWLELDGIGFSNFLEDMGYRPEGYSIERVDVEGDYEPSNCKWIPLVEQVNNRRLGRNNTSGKTGVSWKEKLGKWTASITVGPRGESKNIYLGLYTEFEDAVKAREEAEITHFGRIKP